MRDERIRWESAQPVGGVRARQAATLLRHWQAQPAATTAIILADFNQPVAEHYDAQEWRVISNGLRSPAVNNPLDDGVKEMLTQQGFRCAYDGSKNNFGGRAAPPMTHWTGTTVDYAYLRSESFRVHGAYVHYTALSDHLPVVVDVVPNGAADGV